MGTRNGEELKGSSRENVVFAKEKQDDEEKLKQKILDASDSASQTPNQIVSSSNPIPSSNQKGDNPPHAKAKNRYEQNTTTFICTMENPNKDTPEPVVAELEKSGTKLAAAAALLGSAGDAARAAQGSDETPGDAVTYG